MVFVDSFPLRLEQDIVDGCFQRPGFIFFQYFPCSLVASFPALSPLGLVVHGCGAALPQPDRSSAPGEGTQRQSGDPPDVYAARRTHAHAPPHPPEVPVPRPEMPALRPEVLLHPVPVLQPWAAGCARLARPSFLPSGCPWGGRGAETKPVLLFKHSLQTTLSADEQAASIYQRAFCQAPLMQSEIFLSASSPGPQLGKTISPALTSTLNELQNQDLQKRHHKEQLNQVKLTVANFSAEQSQHCWIRWKRAKTVFDLLNYRKVTKRSFLRRVAPRPVRQELRKKTLKQK